MFRGILFFSLTLMLTSNSFAMQTKNDSFACLSKGLLKQLAKAAKANDALAATNLFASGCIMLKGGLQVSILENTDGIIRMKIQNDDNSAEMWTVISSLQKTEDEKI